jgi:hypothetical protein
MWLGESQNSAGLANADQVSGKIPYLSTESISERKMREPKKEPETKEKKREKELRDLKPNKDVKGGVRSGDGNDKRSPRRTGEIDFMNWE